MMAKAINSMTPRQANNVTQLYIAADEWKRKGMEICLALVLVSSWWDTLGERLPLVTTEFGQLAHPLAAAKSENTGSYPKFLERNRGPGSMPFGDCIHPESV